MSGAQHTPGPWKALIHETLADAREDSGFTWLHSEAEAARFLPLGCVWQDTGSGLTGLPGHVETTAANARLIAAAPDYDAAADHAIAAIEALTGTIPEDQMDALMAAYRALRSARFKAGCDVRPSERAALAKARGETA